MLLIAIFLLAILLIVGFIIFKQDTSYIKEITLNIGNILKFRITNTEKKNTGVDAPVKKK